MNLGESVTLTTRFLDGNLGVTQLVNNMIFYKLDGNESSYFLANRSFYFENGRAEYYIDDISHWGPSALLYSDIIPGDTPREQGMVRYVRPVVYLSPSISLSNYDEQTQSYTILDE